MDKWEKYGSYERWKEYNFSELMRKYDQRNGDKYDPYIPDTYLSFDDFCMGQWQSI